MQILWNVTKYFVVGKFYHLITIIIHRDNIDSFQIYICWEWYLDNRMRTKMNHTNTLTIYQKWYDYDIIFNLNLRIPGSFSSITLIVGQWYVASCTCRINISPLKILQNIYYWSFICKKLPSFSFINQYVKVSTYLLHTCTRKLGKTCDDNYFFFNFHFRTYCRLRYTNLT